MIGSATLNKENQTQSLLDTVAEMVFQNF